MRRYTLGAAHYVVPSITHLVTPTKVHHEGEASPPTCCLTSDGRDSGGGDGARVVDLSSRGALYVTIECPGW